MSSRACWGRSRYWNFCIGNLEEHPFGDLLLFLAAGDFLQLNPVLSDSLLEAFLRDNAYCAPRSFTRFGSCETDESAVLSLRD